MIRYSINLEYIDVIRDFNSIYRAILEKEKMRNYEVRLELDLRLEK